MSHSHSKLAGMTLGIALLANGCATIPPNALEPPARLSVAAQAPTVYHQIRRNDRLADIALEITGDMNNWQAIAEHNGITNTKRLQVGSFIEIPSRLIPGATVEQASSSIARAADELGRAGKAETNPRAFRRYAAIESSDVILTPVNVNRHFDLSPLKAGSSFAGAELRQVKVIGTYYPKGIYTRPDGASRVIMRIAPGTLLELQREYQDWFKVSTADGDGYLRYSDGETVTRSEKNTASSGQSL